MSVPVALFPGQAQVDAAKKRRGDGDRVESTALALLTPSLKLAGEAPCGQSLRKCSDMGCPARVVVAVFVYLIVQS